MTNYTLTSTVGALTLAGRSAKALGGTSTADAFTVGDVASYAYRPGALISEGVVIGEQMTPTALYHMVLTSGVSVRDAFRIGFPGLLTSGVAVGSLLTALRGATIVEGLKLADTLLPTGKYRISMVEHFTLADALDHFISATLNDGFVVGDTLSPAALGFRTISETVTLQDQLTPLLLISVTMAEGVTLSDTSVLKAILHGTLQENIFVKALYIAPSGDTTTWVVNTRTGAVTEYQNFAFKSFARLGNRYIAASDDGLYELLGDTDAGQNINARMKGGVLQVNGARYTGLKGAYLGMRVKDGADEFFLKLHSGDGKTYVYALQPNNMKTTKVNIGKGLRSRYFQWELVTNAADFDLDTIEFVPMLSTRRV